MNHNEAYECYKIIFDDFKESPDIYSSIIRFTMMTNLDEAVFFKFFEDSIYTEFDYTSFSRITDKEIISKILSNEPNLVKKYLCKKKSIERMILFNCNFTNEIRSDARDFIHYNRLLFNSDKKSFLNYRDENKNNILMKFIDNDIMKYQLNLLTEYGGVNKTNWDELFECMNRNTLQNNFLKFMIHEAKIPIDIKNKYGVCFADYWNGNLYT